YNKDRENMRREYLEKEILEYRDRAVRLARENKQTIIFAGLNHDYDVEGSDKESLKLPYHQDELIEAVLDANPDAVVVIMGGAPVEMDWLNKAKAVVWYYYSGLEGATAVAEVLTGKVNPSGKLPETFPKHTEDIYSVKLGEFGKSDKLEYKDGVFVGYRYYVSHNIETNFCFGHGLSYTEFSLGIPDVRCEGGKVIVSAALRNIGTRKGKETVQLYITPPQGRVERPLMELKAFKKKTLEPEEKKNLKFILDRSAFAYYDEQLHGYRVEPGEYKISLGMSVQDIRQSVTVRYSYEKGFEC
ncbi:MAG: glycoside hydrolase family 3 C-terminal domain-containing protein, partial [Lachnospiraceae bacterium]